MNWRAFGIGAGIGIAAALAILLATTLFFRWIPGASIVNFGPAILVFGLLFAELALAAIFLLVGSMSLFRRRWRWAGFALGASIVIIGWDVAWFALGG